jgi:simple sugar transport system permease protein
VYAAIGEVFTERSGILNLGIEGTMFLGAFVGFTVAYQANQAGIAAYLWIGLISAILAGIVIGMLMGFFTVQLGLNQHVSGLGITLLCTGLSLFGFRLVFGERPVLPSIDPPHRSSSLNVCVGKIYHHLLTYIAFLVLVPLSWWLPSHIRRTFASRRIRRQSMLLTERHRTRYLVLALNGGFGDRRFCLAQPGVFSRDCRRALGVRR